MALWFSLEFDGDGARHRPLADPKSIDLVWKVSGKSRKLKVRPRGFKVSLVMEVAIRRGRRAGRSRPDSTAGCISFKAPRGPPLLVFTLAGVCTVLTCTGFLLWAVASIT